MESKKERLWINALLCSLTVIIMLLAGVLIFRITTSNFETELSQIDRYLSLGRVITPFLVLLLTWLVGQRVISYWNVKRKLRESDLESEKEFHSLIGVFKSIWRGWKYEYQKNKDNSNNYTTERWELLNRAADSEGRIEALLLELCSSREIADDNLFKLGVFRQIYQRLREGIRDFEPLNDRHDSPIYIAFHQLYPTVLAILKLERTDLSEDDSYKQFTKVMQIRKEVLTVESFKKPNEIYLAPVDFKIVKNQYIEYVNKKT